MQATQVKPKSLLLASSIGHKLLVALTGLFLISFLLVHLLGNLQLLINDGGASFNEYAHFMGTNPVIGVLEYGLVLGFGLHIITALYTNYLNARSRPVGYAVVHSPVNIFSRSMVYTGSLTLIFLILHLRQFFVEEHWLKNPSTLYDKVAGAFHNPVYVVLYVLAMVLLSFHLMHGFFSAFQTLGWLINRKVANVVSFIGFAFAILICAAFAYIPIYLFIAA